MIHFTSDTHFFHKNIVDYCNRPFRLADGQPDTQSMNRDMIAKWNAQVGKNDLVFHLGDFAFGSPGRARGIREALNGSIFLIKGNHDSQPSKWLLPVIDKWAHFLQVGPLFMCHVPPGPNDHRDLKAPPIPNGTKVVICGHVHGKWKEKEVDGMRVINVGCDVNGLRPISLAEVGLDPDIMLTVHGRLTDISNGLKVEA